jgi:hypothetical protein
MQKSILNKRRLDKRTVRISKIGQNKPEQLFWLNQSPESRLEALEYLRLQSGYNPSERLQRTVIVIKRLWR